MYYAFCKFSSFFFISCTISFSFFVDSIFSFNSSSLNIFATLATAFRSIDGFVDGASVDSLVLTQYAKKHPQAIKKLKIIQKLGPFTISPIVARSNLSQSEFLKLQNLFLNMHNTKIGKEILKHLNIDRFEKPSSQTYDKIYKMTNFLKDNK